MEIKVLNELNKEIFKGETDEFLFIQDNDTELKFFLNKLESLYYSRYYKFINYNIEKFYIEKIKSYC